jgi:hypothetical protein
MSRILDYYRGEGTDTKGRSLKEIWDWDNDSLEEVHDFIQWLFPLPEPSQFNPDAPLLSAEDIAAFQCDPVLRANLMKSFERILGFLGLAADSEGKIVEGSNLSTRIPDVWAMLNHNWLRITRILRCLTLLGMEAQAKALYERLSVFFASSRFPIPPATFEYWTNAVNTP